MITKQTFNRSILLILPHIKFQDIKNMKINKKVSKICVKFFVILFIYGMNEI